MKDQNRMPVLTGNNRDKKGRFNKGISGNPNGRPVGSVSITSAIKKELNKLPNDGKKLFLNY